MASITHRYTGMEYETAAKYDVNMKDVFHLDNLYMQIHEWLVENGYATRKDEDFPEIFYLNKESAGGKEIWVRWRPSKLPRGAKNILWRFDMDIDIHVLTLKDVELAVEGKKYAAHKGEVEVKVIANVVYDYKKAFEKSILKPFKEILFKRRWKEQKKELKEELYKEAYELRDAINTFLKIETFLGEGEAPEFWPKRTP